MYMYIGILVLIYTIYYVLSRVYVYCGHIRIRGPSNICGFLFLSTCSPALCVCVCVRVRVRAQLLTVRRLMSPTELHYTILLELHYTILSLTVGRLSTISHTLNHTPHIETWTRRLTHHIPIQPNPTQHSATISKEQHTCVRKSIYATDRPDGHERTVKCKLLWQHFFF